jgi:AraC-like DNA-binding protein
MWGFAQVCRVAAAALGLLLAAVLLRDHPSDRASRAAAALLLTVIAHLLLPLLLGAGLPLWALHAVLILNLSVPFAFWLLAQVHFEDDFRLSGRHLAGWAGLVAVGYPSCLATLDEGLIGGWLGRGSAGFWEVAPKLLSFAVVLLAMMRIYAGAGTDLLLPRIRLRFRVLAASGTYMIIELLGELLLRGPDSAPLADRVHSATVLGFLFAVCFAAFRTTPQMLRPSRPSPNPEAADPGLVERLQRLIDVDQAFREEGLTIRALADRLGTQEHRLRELINAQLGFKNFNAFLHHHRIREARKALSDPAKAHLGVAQVAYHVGYRSLATFNRAFKELTGRTPTELRAR